MASGDAERRRIERNLHDGAQQHLVALAVNLRLARDIITDDSDAGLEMLDQLADEVQETIQEVRQLAHGIYPPLLVDSGLVEALRAAANRSPLPVDISADGIGRYPSETEAAVYFCCLEALQNAAKHAPDAHVDLRLWEEAGGLLFTVADDGPGFDPDRRRRVTATSTWRTGWARSAGRSDGSPRSARAPLCEDRFPSSERVDQTETNSFWPRSSHSRRRVSAPRCSLLR